MKTTTTSQTKKHLIKQFHAVLSASGVDQNGKDAILSGFGVESSKDLTEAQLKQSIAAIVNISSEPDKWRKRAIAAIGAWLRSINKDENLEYIKGVACKSAKCDNFNKIPVGNLRNVYYEFKRKAETSVNVQAFKDDTINRLKMCN